MHGVVANPLVVQGQPLPNFLEPRRTADEALVCEFSVRVHFNQFFQRDQDFIDIAHTQR